MGELKTKGREGVKENQDKYQEIQESAEQSLEERNRNIEIVHSLEGVDDDDKASIEDSKEQGKEIADQIAESQMEAPKSEVNSRMENTVSEMKDLEGHEKMMRAKQVQWMVITAVLVQDWKADLKKALVNSMTLLQAEKRFRSSLTLK